MSKSTKDDKAPAAYVGAGMTDAQIIAQRTTDTDADSANHYTKVFVMAGVKPTEENGIDHSANKAATREFAIQNGLRPTGDVELKSIEHNMDGLAWDVTYTVPVELTERVGEPSGPNFVTQGKPAPANKKAPAKKAPAKKAPAKKAPAKKAPEVKPEPAPKTETKSVPVKAVTKPTE